MRVDVSALTLQQIDAQQAFFDRHMTLRRAIVANIIKVDHLTNVGQRKADALCPQNPRKPRAIAFRVNAGRPSPHWGDQTQLWARGDYKPMVLSRERIGPLGGPPDDVGCAALVGRLAEPPEQAGAPETPLGLDPQAGGGTRPLDPSERLPRGPLFGLHPTRRSVRRP